MQPFTDKICLFLWQKFSGQIKQQINDFIMCIYHSFAFIFALLHMLAYHTDHPYDTRNVIDMFMCHKDSSNLFPVNSGML